MANRLDELELKEAAEQAAGNWSDFQCFVWYRRDEIEDPENWAIVYTHHRDSGLLDQSNANVIREAIEPFTDGDDPNVVMESHNHWAVGHVDGFSIRVFDTRKQITEAFKTYYELAEAMAEYPVLDEHDYSERELEATLENITDAAWRVKNEYDLPDGWEGEVYSWLSDNDPSEVENVDDQGGYPSEEALRAAFNGLGFADAEAVST